jgi:hypothetical protein
MTEPIFMKLGISIMAPEPIETKYFKIPSLQSVCLYVIPLPLLANGFGKNVTAAMNTQATIEELLVTSFSMRCV